MSSYTTDILLSSQVLVSIGFNMSPVEGLPWLEMPTRAIPNKAGRITYGKYGTIPGKSACLYSFLSSNLKCV